MNTNSEIFDDKISRKKYIKRLSQLMALSFILEIILSWRLWIPVDREFPMVSAFSWFDFSMGSVGGGILTFTLVTALAFILVDKHRKLAIQIMFASLLVLILEDITRFQPWVYIQGTILIFIGFYKNGRENAIQSGATLVVALTYIWSGIQKLNLGFIKETFPWILSTFGFDLQIKPDQAIGISNYLILLVPLLECLIGFFLLISKTRKPGVIMGIFMHLFIILSLGPIGHNWNQIVLPWNLSLALFLILFYLHKDRIRITEGFKPIKLNYFILILFGMMPALNFFGYWDSALSGAMYSGTHSNVAYYFNARNNVELTKNREASTTVIIYKNSDFSVSKTWLSYWSINDINVPFYQAERYYKRLGKKLCKASKFPSSSGIEITTRSKFHGAKLIRRYSCKDLR